MKRYLTGSLTACLAALALAASAGAQGGPVGLTGSVWTGNENLDGFGTLKFEFLAGGKVVMTDAKERVDGAYTQTGSQVRLAFFNGTVIYTGTLKGQQIAGTASNGKASWGWSVQRQGGGLPPAPMPGPGGNAPGGVGPGGAAQGKLTPQNLSEYLRKVGFQPQVMNPPNGTPYCVLNLKNDAGWNFAIEVTVTKEGGMWLTAPLGQLPQGEAPANRLLQLLEANNPIAPCFFTYRAADNRICMKLEVVGTQADRFRADLTMMCNTIQQTHTLWNTPAWQGNPGGNP
ncbi:MAG: hypothetical protein L0Z62_50335 [Gemmataceae bacterium]|nr:hypothetical protein [Gemmataceae bacterium]